MRVFIHVLLMALLCVSFSMPGSAQEWSTDQKAKILIPPGPIVPQEDFFTDPDQSPQSADVMLREMTPEKRANADLSILLEPAATGAALKKADELCRLWNEGAYQAALDLFSELEALTDPREISIGIDWRPPLLSPTEKSWGGDVRIGLRDSIYVVDLSADPQSGHLFATCVYRSGASGSGWAMYFSNDDGQTWSEMYAWSATYHIGDLSTTIVAEHCYVFFTRGSNQDQVLGYRFRLSDGARDNFPGGTTYVTAFTTMVPEAIEEVAVVSNIDFDAPGYFRMYIVAITSLDSLKYYWDDEEAESWMQDATGIDNADRGLDISLNVGYSDHWAFISYIDNDPATPRARIYGYDSYAWTSTLSNSVNSNSCIHTTIGAHQDTVHCFYDYYSGSRYYVKYHVTYNGGLSYFFGIVDDTTVTSYAPALCARRGGGVGVSYRFYVPSENRFTWRDYGGWPWDIPPQPYSDNFPDYKQAAIDYIGGDVYGIVYISTLTNSTPWFDLGPGCCDTPGDANNDRAVNVGDAVYLINYAFKGGPPPVCTDEGDANVDCLVNVGDVVYLINYAFKGGPEPACGCTVP